MARKPKFERPAPLPRRPRLNLARPDAWPKLDALIAEARRQLVLAVEMEGRGEPGADEAIDAWGDRADYLERLALAAPAPDRGAVEVKLRLIEREPGRDFDVIGDKKGVDGARVLIADLRRFLSPLATGKARQ